MMDRLYHRALGLVLLALLIAVARPVVGLVLARVAQGLDDSLGELSVAAVLVLAVALVLFAVGLAARFARQLHGDERDRRNVRRERLAVRRAADDVPVHAVERFAQDPDPAIGIGEAE